MPVWLDSYELALIGTAAAAAVSCSLPGLWLVLRRHSMMGDALSHSALLGVVGALLTVNWMHGMGWVPDGGLSAAEDAALVLGAVVVGLLTAYLTQLLQDSGRVESGASLGVVFSSLFALGLFLIRWKADSADLDADCVLFGVVELAATETVGSTGIPRPLLLNGAVLLLNAAVMAAAFKELRLASFDEDYAATRGLRPAAVHYALMTACALTVVAAFRTVGSILVVGLLVIPAATALLLTRRLKTAVWWTVGVAAATAVLSRLLCNTLPGLLFGGWGVTDSSTSGMMAVAGGGLFTLAWLFSPQGGVVTRLVRQTRRAARSEADSLLRCLYRMDEQQVTPQRHAVEEQLLRSRGGRRPRQLTAWLAAAGLRQRGYASLEEDQWRLTGPGRERAKDLIRSHRLVEAYFDQHFALPKDHLHGATTRVEAYVDAELRERLAEELDGPEEDPHGRAIPQ